MVERPTLEPEFWEELADWKGCSVEEVLAWWDFIWLTYSARQYKLHKKAIKSWWSRTSDSEIQRAMELKSAKVEKASVQELLELRREPAERAEKVDHFATLREAKNGRQSVPDRIGTSKILGDYPGDFERDGGIPEALRHKYSPADAF